MQPPAASGGEDDLPSSTHSELTLTRNESLTGAENRNSERDIPGAVRTDDASRAHLLLLDGPVAGDRLFVASTVCRESLPWQEEAEKRTLQKSSAYMPPKSNG